MTEKEALQILTGKRDDYNDYARALNIAIRVLKERVAVIDRNETARTNGEKERQKMRTTNEDEKAKTSSEELKELIVEMAVMTLDKFTNDLVKKANESWQPAQVEMLERLIDKTMIEGAK